MKLYFANKQGQDLARHSVLVGRLAEALIVKMYAESAYGQGDEGTAKVKQMRRVAKLGGYLHDTGKIDPGFQSYIATVQNKKCSSEVFLFEDGEQIEEKFDKKRFSFNDYPRHEEASWLLNRRLLDKSRLQKNALEGDNSSNSATVHYSQFTMLEHTVYWHHAKPLRDKEDQTKKFSDAEQLAARMRSKSDWLDNGAFEDYRELLAQIDAIEGQNLAALMCEGPNEATSDAFKVPAFKAIYENEELLLGDPLTLEKGLAVEMARTAIRSAVVSADRIVSSLTSAQLNEHVALKTLPNYVFHSPQLDVLYRQIELMTEDFSTRFPGKRTDEQSQAAVGLAEISSKRGIACLQGPAGCGKTKIALQYLGALRQQKRVFIFVPRTAIGEALFNELIGTYGVTAGVEFLSGSKKLFSRMGSTGYETIETPENMQGTGNLVITTIDQLCRTMLSHQKIDLVTQLGDSHLIFDEFHELVELPGIVLLFLELMRLRLFTTTGTLLVSATPNPRLLDLLKVGPRSVLKVTTFNTKPLTLNLKEWNPLVYAGGAKAAPHPFYAGELNPENGAFLVCNTATVAQQASVTYRIKGRNVICFHSKFTPKDKSVLLLKILNLFGRKSLVSDELLISGPIVQASLDISTRNMYTEMCHGENALQRMGRVNRFGEMDSATVNLYYAIDSPNAKTGITSLANSTALGSMNQKFRTNAFYRFLAKKHGAAIQENSECVVTLNQLYDWYDEFHQATDTQVAYQADFESILKASSKVFALNDFDPIQYPIPLKKTSASGRLSKNTLRGKSYYILPLSLRLTAVGTKGELSLLWTQLSEANQVLTDEMRASVFSEEVRGKYWTWTKEASKPSILSHVTAGSGVDFLKSMTLASKSCKTWPQIKGKALRRESPILVCCEKYDDENMYYFEYSGLKIGLIKAANLAKIQSLRIKNAV